MTGARAYRLEDFVTARAVAIVGASQDPGRIGGRPIDFLRRAGFEGRLYPVNAKYTEVQGLVCYPSVDALPEPPDVAIIAVPAREVSAVLLACADRGVKGAIVYSSGFAEVGDAGRALQEEVARVARQTGVRVIGPNCQGLTAVHQRLNLSFSSALVEMGAPGAVGLVAQSGAVGGMLAAMLRERGAGLSYWMSIGNEADVDLPECIEFLARDPQTRVVGAYVESIRDGRRLLSAIARARAAGKPVVLLRAGRSTQAARAAASHTGALAPEHRVAAALLREAGAAEVRDVQELLDHIYLFARVETRPGRRVAILSSSGGLGVIMSDTCADLGLEVPALSESIQDRLRAILPAFGATGNPVDTTAQLLSDHTLLSRSLAILLDAPEIDQVVVALSMVNQMYPVSTIVDDVAAVARSASKPVLVSWMASIPGGAERFQAAGVPVFADSTGCLKALAATVRFASAARVAPPVSGEAPDGSRSAEARRLLDVAGSGPLDEHTSTAALRLYGVPTAEERLVATPDEAVKAANELGYPVALKVCAAAIPHKSDHGLVVLGLGGATEVAAAGAELSARARRAFPGVAIRGLLVQRMAPGGGLEVALGVMRDASFGPVVTVALGGVFVEHFDDVAFGLAPLGREQALAMICSLRAAPLLRGARGRPPVDEDALADALARLSRLAFDLRDRVREIDVNPLIALPRGQGVLAVDALIVSEPSRPGSDAPS